MKCLNQTKYKLLKFKMTQRSKILGGKIIISLKNIVVNPNMNRERILLESSYYKYCVDIIFFIKKTINCSFEIFKYISVFQDGSWTFFVYLSLAEYWFISGRIFFLLLVYFRTDLELIIDLFQDGSLADIWFIQYGTDL